MTLKPIRNDEDYRAALQAIEQLWDAEPGTPESDTLDSLVTLVEAYERDRYDLPAPDPIAALEYFMESRGWTRKQLEPCIGSRGRVSEVLSRKRSLALPMMGAFQFRGVGRHFQRKDAKTLGRKAKHIAPLRLCVLAFGVHFNFRAWLPQVGFGSGCSDCNRPAGPPA